MPRQMITTSTLINGSSSDGGFLEIRNRSIIKLLRVWHDLPLLSYSMCTDISYCPETLTHSVSYRYLTLQPLYNPTLVGVGFKERYAPKACQAIQCALRYIIIVRKHSRTVYPNEQYLDKNNLSRNGTKWQPQYEAYKVPV